MIYDVNARLAIKLGWSGEADARTIKLDISPLTELCPDAVWHLLYQRPEAEMPYDAVTTLEDNVLTWHITALDAAVAGRGSFQVVGVQTDTVTGVEHIVAKSPVHTVGVDQSLEGHEQNPIEIWLQQAQEAAQRAEGAAIDARMSADAAAQSADQAATNANAATGAADAARQDAQTATQAAQAATAAADTAKMARTDATQAAQEALASAESASNSENDAREYAERAQMGATNAGYCEFHEIDGHVWYVRTSTAPKDIDFSIDTDGRLILTYG